MIPSKKEESWSYHEQNTCHICKEEFGADDMKYYKVYDHCHYTGKYRAAVYNTWI